MVKYYFKKDGKTQARELMLDEEVYQEDEDYFYNNDIDIDELEHTETFGTFGKVFHKYEETREHLKEYHTSAIDYQKQYFESDDSDWLRQQRAINDSIFLRKLFFTLVILAIILGILFIANLK